MIPKIIHYCWLGSGKLPKSAVACIDSWKRFCPDYEIKLWNEDNYDFSKNKYMNQTFQAKKWGFVPDFARLDIVYNHGGIYLDTDVEIVKSPDPLLDKHFFAGIMYTGEVNLGCGFGAEAKHPLLKELMDDYDNYSFYKTDGTIDLTPSPDIQTRYLTKNYDFVFQKGYDRIQKLKNQVVIYPYEYFDPLYRDDSTLRIQLHVTPRTYSIHHYTNSWVPWHRKQIGRMKILYQRVLLLFNNIHNKTA